MNNTKLETIQFHNQSLIVLNHENKPYIAIKPICENIGLDWEAQRQRIKRNEILNSTACMIKVVAKDGKNREVLCLPLGYLNGWLAGIELSRVNPQIKPLLKQYQLECFDVLYNHFMPKVAQQYPNTISVEQQQAIKQAVNERSYRTGEHHQAIYTKFYQQFKIPRYQDLPASKFDEAIQWLGGVHARNGLSDEDWYDLAWLYKVADRMRSQIELVEPALRALDSSFVSAFHSMAIEYKRNLHSAKLIIERETAHINAKNIIDKWNNVLPVIRHH
ncbi:phage antirepressor N-terminal domain-containing protein [Gilliamella apis]|uniref:phage antirepressor N-terminal domain-containing protein n=1 Tax=Gilliamella apis TaxID=1970738 RepID=UPI0015E8E743|nr:phage antirepressor N-terminal domain-containing protein [Gilliamella apis]WLS93582.1 phage antirepressor N-terminal domain-containing protein [Gilliamella apis]